LSIQTIKGQIERLSTTEVLDIEAFLQRHIHNQALQVALTKRAQAVLNSPCSQCGFACLMRWGRSDAGTQRFKCRNCGATLGTTNTTPFFRLRKRHLWTRYLGLLTRHMPLKALPENGIPLSLPTLHRWRHRFLSALVTNPEAKLAGLIESDEKFFRTSFKGSRGWKRKAPPQDRRARKRGGADQRGTGSQQVPVLTALDRSGAIFQTVLPNLQKATVLTAMAPWIEGDSVICTDGHAAYPEVAKQTGCEHIVAKKRGQTVHSENTRGLSIGRIDAYHRDVENLINRRCMGVGTRYLMNYFGWARRITQHKPFGQELMGELMGV